MSSDVIEIPLRARKYTGLKTVIDAKNWDEVKDLDWSPVKDRNTFYAHALVNGRWVLMHRLITGYRWPMTDHKDGNGLNNLESNLREANPSLNAANAGKPRRADQATSTTWTRFKGVKAHQGKFAAQIGYRRQRIFIGAYATDVEAAMAYNDAAEVLFGEYARLNEIDPREMWEVLEPAECIIVPAAG